MTKRGTGGYEDIRMNKSVEGFFDSFIEVKYHFIFIDLRVYLKIKHLVNWCLRIDVKLKIFRYFFFPENVIYKLDVRFIGQFSRSCIMCIRFPYMDSDIDIFFTII